MRQPIIATACVLTLAAAIGSAAVAQAPAPPPAVATAGHVDDFRLVTAAGRSEDLYRYKDAKAVVLVMHAVGSPEFRRIAPALQALEASYAAKGVRVMLLNST